ncbi:hypothetical protein NC652_000587 [Populus alba x Populus x berolinensis]|nr:hypothetical protein NC652_000587 [Populus alba x Populus x berolinensis]
MVGSWKTKDDITEELKILQKVSHANLVKLMGMSSGFDREGNRFLVYEFAENGSLEKWLHPTSESSSSSSGFLTWSQRLHVALDVANGLQYMHEHTQPSIVYKDTRTTNILLDSTFRINKKDKPSMKYVCEGARAGPREELKQAKNLDDEANTTADLLADIDLSHNIKTEDDSNTITKNTTKVGEINND